MEKETKVQKEDSKEGKNNKNVLIVAAVVAVLLIIIGLCCSLLVPKNGSTVIGNKLGETKKVDELEIKNISITQKGEECTLTADAYNPTNEVRGMTYIDIKVLNKEGEVENTFGGYIDRVEAGEMVKITASITADITDAYDIQMVENTQEIR